jgi:hypothetical protein
MFDGRADIAEIIQQFEYDIVNPGYSYPYAFLPHPISFNSFLLSW